MFLYFFSGPFLLALNFYRKFFTPSTFGVMGEGKEEERTPLVLSATGGMDAGATTFYKRLAAILSQKWETPYSKTKGMP